MAVRTPVKMVGGRDLRRHKFSIPYGQMADVEAFIVVAACGTTRRTRFTTRAELMVLEKVVEAARELAALGRKETAIPVETAVLLLQFGVLLMEVEVVAEAATTV